MKLFWWFLVRFLIILLCNTLTCDVIYQKCYGCYNFNNKNQFAYSLEGDSFSAMNKAWRIRICTVQLLSTLTQNCRSKLRTEMVNRLMHIGYKNLPKWV